MRADRTDPGSFRDPSGFVFHRDGEVLRQVNLPYREHYDHLLSSGLHEELVDRGLLVAHEELSGSKDACAPGAYKVIRPRRVEFITYPYEWCFSQLKAAARTTLEAHKRALEYGMVLKDASAYNVQFLEGKAVLIDTLSFEKAEAGAPWIGYRQFCQHFVAPLALSSRVGVELRALHLAQIDGVELDLASRLLPRRTWLRLGLLIHIHLHARSQRKHAASSLPERSRSLTANQQLALVDSLRSTVDRLRWQPKGTVWADYYDETSYSAEEEGRKRRVVDEYLDLIGPGAVLDLGANTGRYSRVAAEKGRFTLSCDLDPAAVERNYLQCVAEGETRVLPLLIDLRNPSPALGWASRERAAFVDRFSGHNLLALALVHHLAISNNVPLPLIARFLSELGQWLVIEFVPKTDPQVQRLLASREDIFDEYTVEGFEDAFESRFEIRQQEEVSTSGRRVYLMRRHSAAA